MGFSRCYFSAVTVPQQQLAHLIFWVPEETQGPCELSGGQAVLQAPLEPLVPPRPHPLAAFSF